MSIEHEGQLYCERCGKRVGSGDHGIHTCSPHPVITKLREKLAAVTRERDEFKAEATKHWAMAKDYEEQLAVAEKERDEALLICGLSQEDAKHRIALQKQLAATQAEVEALKQKLESIGHE